LETIKKKNNIQHKPMAMAIAAVAARTIFLNTRSLFTTTTLLKNNQPMRSWLLRSSIDHYKPCRIAFKQNQQRLFSSSSTTKTTTTTTRGLANVSKPFWFLDSLKMLATSYVFLLTTIPLNTAMRATTIQKNNGLSSEEKTSGMWMVEPGRFKFLTEHYGPGFATGLAAVLNASEFFSNAIKFYVLSYCAVVC